MSRGIPGVGGGIIIRRDQQRRQFVEADGCDSVMGDDVLDA
jgi:hypothetical protein